MFVTSGVPQGSIIAPILFKIFINDLLEHSFYSKIYAFADDIKIVGRPGIELQSDIDFVVNWVAKNGMLIKIDKCQILHAGTSNVKLPYAINETMLPSVPCIKDLGLIFDSDFKFLNHVTALRTKCLRLTGLVFKLFYYRKPELYLKFYRTYILPLIDYGSLLFAGTSVSVDKIIEKIQKTFTRRLYMRVFKTSLVPTYSDRLLTFEIESLKTRYIKQELIFIYRFKTGLFRFNNWHLNCSSRHPNRLILPMINTSRYRSCFMIRPLSHWNKLIPDDRTFKSLSDFKRFLNSLNFDS